MAHGLLACEMTTSCYLYHHQSISSFNNRPPPFFPPKMLTKVDIEIVYDTLSWGTILATLVNMNLSSNWVSYIKALL